jgi:hypothetical protein
LPRPVFCRFSVIQVSPPHLIRADPFGPIHST